MSTSAKSHRQQSAPMSVARRLSPEDICVGDAVMLSEVQYEFPSFFWCDSDPARIPPERPVRISFRAGGERGLLRVQSVCLPFVLCTEVQTGRALILDVRQVQLMRLSQDFARSAKKFLKRKKSKKRRNK